MSMKYKLEDAVAESLQQSSHLPLRLAVTVPADGVSDPWLALRGLGL